MRDYILSLSLLLAFLLGYTAVVFSQRETVATKQAMNVEIRTPATSAAGDSTPDTAPAR